MWRCIPVLACAAALTITPLHHPAQFLARHGQPPTTVCEVHCRWVWWGPTIEPAQLPPPEAEPAPIYVTTPGGVVYPAGHGGGVLHHWKPRHRHQRPTPIPEPGSAMMLLVACGLVALLRARSRSAP